MTFTEQGKKQETNYSSAKDSKVFKAYTSQYIQEDSS